MEFARRQYLVVEKKRGVERDFVTVEDERRACASGRIRPDLKNRRHACLGPVQDHIEVDAIDQVIGNAVLGETDRASFIRTHQTTSESTASGYLSGRSALEQVPFAANARLGLVDSFL